MNIKHPRSQIDYMLRETRSQLINLSQMADIKANILLSIAAVLSTISIAKLTDPTWTLPIVVLVICLMIAIFLALLAVIPNLFSARRAKRSTHDPDFNSLFFADYAQVSYPDYLAHMEEVMNDTNRIYEVQVREIYFAGKFLEAKKYRYISYGYIMFFTGLILSIGIYTVRMI